jgi:hypothetical protein
MITMAYSVAVNDGARRARIGLAVCLVFCFAGVVSDPGGPGPWRSPRSEGASHASCTTSWPMGLTLMIVRAAAADQVLG